jgi:YnbE-like lipoprotein
MKNFRYILVAGVALTALSACVRLEGGNKPIEINLNVNIKQEVVIRLEKDVQDLVKKNPAIF